MQGGLQGELSAVTQQSRAADEECRRLQKLAEELRQQLEASEADAATAQARAAASNLVGAIAHVNVAASLLAQECM